MVKIIVHSSTSRVVVAERFNFLRVFVSSTRRVDVVEEV